MALNLVMIGPPGAGKGTQAALLCRQYGIPKISTGDILREAVAAGSTLGREVQHIIGAGRLVSDDMIIKVVAERLMEPDAKKGFVLDGFPRTVVQSHALDGMLVGRGPLVVVVLDVPTPELVKRLAWRRVCADCGTSYGVGEVPELTGERGGEGPVESGRCRKCGGPLVQRPDDDDSVVRDRLQVYEQQTRPLVDFYKDRPTYAVVDGLQSQDEVTADLKRAIERAMAIGDAEERGRARA